VGRVRGGAHRLAGRAGRALLARRFRGQGRQVRSGLAVYDDPAVKAVVPDPRLRMGLALLRGTAGDVAVAVIRGGIYESVFFGRPPAGDFVGAQVIAAPELRIVVNERFQFENPVFLAMAFAHEVLHQDLKVDNTEELAANVVEDTVLAELFLEQPSVAYSGTELARRSNTSLLARLNTRDASGRLRLFATRGNVFPGGLPLPNYATLSNPSGAPTTGNPTLRAMLRAITGSSPRNPDFDDRTLALLDQCQRQLSPSEVLRLARILRLDTSG
jgi:hypothetical protein